MKLPLTKITDKTSGGAIIKVVEQSYDVLDRWVRRNTDPDGAGAMPARNTFFVYAGESINAQLQFDGTAASNLSHRYLWSDVIDEILADEQVSSLGSTGNAIWALGDQLGTIRDIADQNESTNTTTVTNHRSYNAFGKLTSESNSSVDLLFAFTGKPLDDDSNLQNNWHRWYDSAIGQWLSEDPILFDAGDTNLRRYSQNAPVTLKDAFGLKVDSDSSTAPTAIALPTLPPLPKLANPSDVNVPPLPKLIPAETVGDGKKILEKAKKLPKDAAESMKKAGQKMKEQGKKIAEGLKKIAEGMKMKTEIEIGPDGKPTFRLGFEKEWKSQVEPGKGKPNKEK